MNANLLSERRGRVTRLTLNRPEKRNALNAALCEELVNAIESVAEDSGVGAILLDANGPSFCAGMDLDEALSADLADLAHLHHRLFTLGRRLTKPLVAAVHGSALAGGLGLAVNAHVVVAASDVRFGLTEVRIGLWPYTIFPAVADAVGERCAIELSLTGRIFDAQEALRLGIAAFVVPPEGLAAEAMKIAVAISDAPSAIVREGLGFVREIRGLDAEGTERTILDRRRLALAAADFREGVAAFREKRMADWPSNRS